MSRARLAYLWKAAQQGDVAAEAELTLWGVSIGLLLVLAVLVAREWMT